MQSCFGYFDRRDADDNLGSIDWIRRLLTCYCLCFSFSRLLIVPSSSSLTCPNWACKDST